jgi:hypothetical protein
MKGIITEENTTLVPYLIRLSKAQADTMSTLRDATGQKDNAKLIRFALSELANRHYIDFPMDVAKAGRKFQKK